jgi:hypothetical protein
MGSHTVYLDAPLELAIMEWARKENLLKEVAPAHPGGEVQKIPDIPKALEALARKALKIPRKGAT